MYSLPAYGQMVGDPIRFDAYRDALERAISPTSVVVDLGAGPGVFTLLAAKAGARKVFAIESEPTVEWLDALAKANGVEDRVVAIRARSTDVELEEKVDVLVSDLRGVLPFFGLHLPSLMDARDRWLKPGGRLIARSDTIWAAPVCAPDCYHRQVSGFESRGLSDGGALDLQILHRAACNHWCRVGLESEACLSDPVRLGQLDYAELSSPHFRSSAEWSLTKDGSCHGLAVWFDADLDESGSFSNRPSGSSPLYGQAFFPWQKPMEFLTGDRFKVHFEARLMGEDYVFRWRGHQFRADSLLQGEDQSTFFGAPLGLVDVQATPMVG